MERLFTLGNTPAIAARYFLEMSQIIRSRFPYRICLIVTCTGIFHCRVMIDPADNRNDTRPFVLVLAGGEGSRMGGAKPQRELGGMRLIDRALVQARRYGDEIEIAVRAEGQIKTDLPCVADANGMQGPLAGLSPGLVRAADAGKQYLLLLPIDMPFLPTDLFDRLSRALSENPEANVALVESDGRVHPVCSLWRTDIREILSDYISTGRRSLIGLAEHAGFVSVFWDDLPDPFFNLNTLEDLEAARLRFDS